MTMSRQLRIAAVLALVALVAAWALLRRSNERLAATASSSSAEVGR